MNNDDLLKDLVTSLIEERKSERRNKLFFRITWLILFGLLILIFFSFPLDNAASNNEHTALIEINGVIAPGSTSNKESIIPHVKKAMENNLCFGIILKINSPGGSAVQSKLIHDEILKLKLKHKKPIYSVIEDMGTSGGYYIAASTELIFSSSSSIVGSIGVRLDSFNFRPLMEKLGIKSQTISSGEDKTMLDPFQGISVKHKKHLQSILAEIHNQFINDIKKSRGSKLKKENIFTGLFWTGNQAKKIGLIDDIASTYDVNEQYFNDRVIVNYNKKEGLLDEVLGKTMNRIFNLNTNSLNY